MLLTNMTVVRLRSEALSYWAIGNLGDQYYPIHHDSVTHPQGGESILHLTVPTLLHRHLYVKYGV